MHFHHYSLQHLSQYLNQHCQGQVIQSCISQNKNELVIVLENIHLRIGCHTPLTYIVTAKDFSRARKNVVELFSEIWGRSILKARVVPYERIMILELTNNLQLILKMHGIGANVMLREGNDIIRLFNHKYEADGEYRETAGPFDPSALAANPQKDLESVSVALKKISPIYDKHFARKLLAKLQAEPAQSFQQTFEQIIEEAQSNQFFILKETNRIRFSLFEPVDQQVFAKVDGISAAMGFFMKTHYQYESYKRQYASLEKDLRKPLKKFQKIYASYQQNVEKLQSDRNPEEMGHLLMANLHAIPKRAKEIELDDFYTGAKTIVKLKPELSPQNNAERYYEKHKQRRGKLRYVKSQVDDIRKKLQKAKAEWENFQQIPSPQALSFSQDGFDASELKGIKKMSRGHEKVKREKVGFPFRSFEKDGYQIFVGKSARNNDELSFHFASKDDLWLHAKDVSGSHVIIRQKAGQNIPATVLEYAAQLAAFYSKRKNDTLVPVLYTPRKYVRKRKGEAAGKVAVSREEVIMVEPIRGN